MADLKTLYAEHGLQGIIPYAFGMSGQGYQFLCKRLLEGEPFWAVVAEANHMPFVFADKEKTFFSLYSSQELAIRKCDELAMDKFYTEAVQITSEGWSAQLWKRYRDLGATHLRLDDSVWIDMKDLAPVATYDGYLNQRAPLRNATLNAALYSMEQHLQAGMCSDALKAYFWKLFKESYFYVPVQPKTALKPGEALTADNMEHHFAELEDGSLALLVFTDADFMKIYAQWQNLSSEQCTAAFTPRYETLKEFMDEMSVPILVNFGAGDFLLNYETIEDFELVTLNQAAIEAAASGNDDEQFW